MPPTFYHSALTLLIPAAGTGAAGAAAAVAGTEQLTKNNNNNILTTPIINNNNNNNNNLMNNLQNAIISASTSSAPVGSTAALTLTCPASTPTQCNLASATNNANSVTTMTRIGSIGRTTITCITPAGTAAEHSAAVANTQASALAAAGVELDAVEDNNSMTEVVVKIENSNASSCEEEEEMPEEGEESNEEEEDQEMNYDDIKLSSPMMWAIDSVKIEQEEEFEDILTAGFENTTDMDDEMYQSMGGGDSNATTTTTTGNNNKLSPADTGNNNSTDQDFQKGRILVAKKRVSLQTLKALNKQNSKMPYVTQIELQDPQELLEKHQHFQKLHLQPNTPVQIKLRSIPATITSIQTKLPTAPPSLAPLSSTKSGNTAEGKTATSTSSTEFKATISDDRRYRMITQNQRTRKESLEHSDDMIYNADIEKPWVCRNCNRNYKWKNSLKCHLKNECGQPPRYFCSKLCGYATNVHSNLKRHMNTKCRERTEEENQVLLQQVQVQSPQLAAQGQKSASASSVTTNTNTTSTVAVASTTNSSTTTNSTSTYTLVFQKSE